MELLPNLWLPILLSAVLVFLASSLIHMVVKWHASDYRALPQEAAVREALRGADLPPGQYVIPHCADMKDMASEAMRRKYEEGPVGLLMLSPSRVPNLGASLGQWFLYTVLVGFMVAYLASRSFGPAAHYLKVFRLRGLDRLLEDESIGFAGVSGTSAGAVNAAVLATGLRSAGFGDLLSPVLSADAVRRYKNDPAVYALGPQALGLPAKKILFVSSNGWDAIGATWYGFTTLWVNRSGAPPEQLDTPPTRTAANLRAVLDFFPSR